MMLRRLCIAALMLAPLMATAQGYPTKPIKFIVPYAAGGLPDSVARVVAQRLTEKIGRAHV